MISKRTIITVLHVLLLIVLSIQTATGQTLTVAQNGQAKAVIVVSADATEPEKHAANELAGFLKQITGAEFEIQAPPAIGQSRLLVGPQAAKSATPDFSTNGLGSDGIIIRTVGNDLILAGGRPRGTLYAVYTFLEDHVGCRWWSSKVSTIPNKTTLEIGQINVRYVPPLEYARASGSTHSTVTGLFGTKATATVFA